MPPMGVVGVKSAEKPSGPVSAARMAIFRRLENRAFLRSSRTFGSPRKMLRNAVAKGQIDFPASRRSASRRKSLCSTGSSTVTMRRSIVLSIDKKGIEWTCSCRKPVGPVSRMMPFGARKSVSRIFPFGGRGQAEQRKKSNLFPRQQNEGLMLSPLTVGIVATRDVDRLALPSRD